MVGGDLQVQWRRLFVFLLQFAKVKGKTSVRFWSWRWSEHVGVLSLAGDGRDRRFLMVTAMGGCDGDGGRLGDCLARWVVERRSGEEIEHNGEDGFDFGGEMRLSGESPVVGDVAPAMLR